MVNLTLIVLWCSVIGFPQDATSLGNPLSDFVELNSKDRLQRPESAECGVYALAAAARTFEPDTNVLSILDRRYVTDFRGSSVSDLMQAASDHGFVATPWKSVGVQFLKSSNHPVLLNITRNRSSSCGGHWVTWLGEKDGQAIVYDVLLPERVSTIPYSELLDGMTGDVLLISPTGLSTSEAWRLRLGCFWAFLPLIPMFLLGVFFFGAAGAKIRIHPKWQVVVILGVAIAWGLFANLGRDGVFRSEAVTAWITARHVSEASFADMAVEQFMALRTRSDVVVLDARPSDAFDEAHIVGAESLPVDGTAGLYQDVLSDVSKDELVIVYCASDRCSWDLVVANRLKAFGYSNVRIFEAGFEGYLNWITEKNDK